MRENRGLWINPELVDHSFFPPEEIAQIKALACQLPAERGIPLSRFSIPEIVREVISAAIVPSVSGSSVWRWLHEDAVCPWFHRSWIYPRDPDFIEKAGKVLDLYAKQWEGRPLGPDDYVISADEKTSIQASWFNQIEIYFAIVQKKALPPNDFPSLQMVEKRLLDFQIRYQEVARPFRWKFTRKDFKEKLKLVSDHVIKQYQPITSQESITEKLTSCDEIQEPSSDYAYT